MEKKIGILGGGQLGKMLCQEASKMGIRLHVLEVNDTYPAAAVCPDIVYGNFKSYEDVYSFGSGMDIITVEIESVNTDALIALEKEGKKVYPQPHILEMIKDKGLQKSWYQKHGFPTSQFDLYDGADEARQAIRSGKWKLPVVQKTRKDGYDGQGVKVIDDLADLADIIDAPCILEDKVEIAKEIAVIVARNVTGDVTSFPPVEMEFHPSANLVEFLFSPSSLDADLLIKASTLAENLAKEMGIVGLLAVELFVDVQGVLWINEVAPRPHNSGHQTIEGNIVSQYNQHLRAILDWPLGDTSARCASVMVNILGEEGYAGKVHYHGIEECLNVPGVNLHLYGKSETKPYRKMGHATIVDTKLSDAIEKAKFIKSTLKVISK